ncbi:MAG TPA: hypothetical protein VN742_10235, partial [Candidatus Binataceae bacterium]|jgi:hypothetical protein|nr:hypothetical protein [Candidatus Binataceae bacterium]
MLELKPVAALIPRWLTPFRILAIFFVLQLLIEFLWPNAGLSVSVAHLGGFIGSAALILCGLTFWSKARVQIGRRKLRYKTVRINAGIVAAIGLSFIVVQKTSLKMQDQTEQGRPVAAKTLTGHPLTLGSGKSVEILTVGPVYGKGWSGLMLKYRTLIPLNDLVALRNEADEIWERFVANAEHGGYDQAVISAKGPEKSKGFILSTNNSFNFVFMKKDGSWRTLESPERARAKLDSDFIKEFMGRLDSAYEHDNMNALLLYMANDWNMTVINPSGSGPAKQTLDRMKFVTVSHATLAAATSRKHHSEIVNISIDEGRTVARVESRETNDATINGRHVAVVERLTDIFELRDDVMLWTKSTDTIEKLTTTAPVTNDARVSS